MKELSEIRLELDAIDRQLISLFVRRMELTHDVAAYKLSVGMPVLDAVREAQVLDSRAALAGEPWQEDARELMSCIMALSRAEQLRMIKEVTGQ